MLGYEFFSFGPSESGWLGIEDYIGLTTGTFSRQSLPATFNPELEYDFFVPATWDGYLKMMRYANQSVAGVSAFSATWAWDNYNLINGQTCVGFVYDTMDQADLWPDLYHWSFWSWAHLLEVDLSVLPTSVKLPGYSTGNKPGFFWNQQ